MKKNSKFFYGIGAMGKDLYSAFIGSFLTIYLTDVYGLSGAVMGTLFIVARVWDAVNDPMMGILVDKTRTKWGRFRPYLFLSPIAMAAAMLMLFSVPEISGTGKILWAYAAYILYGMSFTAYDVPYMSFSYVITDDAEKRVSYLAISRIITMLCTGIVGIFALRAMNAFGGGAAGYRAFVVILTMISLLTAWVCAGKSHEVGQHQAEKNSLKDYADMVLKNRPFQRVIVCIVLVTTSLNLLAGTLMFYLKYYIGNTDYYTLIMLLELIVPTIMMAVTGKICKKIGKKATQMMAIALLICGSLILFLSAKTVLLMFAGMVVMFAGIGIILVTSTAQMADTVDYAEWKLGKRSEGVIFSLNSFAIKLGQAVGGGIIGYGLTAIGYEGNQVQGEGTLLGLRILISVVPMLLGLVSILVYAGYELNNRTMKQMESELSKRRG